MKIPIFMELILWCGKTDGKQMRQCVLEGSECYGGRQQRRMIGSAVLNVNIVVRKVALEQRIQGGEGSAEDASGGIWIQAERSGGRSCPSDGSQCGQSEPSLG